MANNGMNDPVDMFFVIDIGTRFVRGLICSGKKPGENAPYDLSKLHILECEVMEHETRAMRAGQIHDIEKVGRIVQRVRDSLGNKLSAERYRSSQAQNGEPGSAVHPILKKVSIAVAGRNLVTYRGRAESSRPLVQPVTIDDIKRVELAAVQNALEQVSSDIEYYCVGYSPSGYWLDGEEIGSLLDHRGAVITAEVLVTLLPRQVLEALFAVMKSADIEIEYLTLEPIASLESTLSQSLRSLDLVLVDIGAGTSDIAIVSKGRIRAYGMVLAAGDMITESVSNEYLIEFHEAERIKREAGIVRASHAQKDAMPQGSIGFDEQNDVPITFRDIFDREHRSSQAELLAKIRPAVTTLSQKIVDEIKKIVPDMVGPGKQYAIVLVGGGSLTPSLEEELASSLQLPRQRIGIRPASLNRELEDETGKLHGPDAATVTGIALLRNRQAGLSLTHLTINDKRVTAVSSEKNPNILSVLLSNGITVKQIYGRLGMAKTFTVNGVLCTIKGEVPKPAVVELNGEKAELDTPVKEGDKIVFYPASQGKDAQKQVRDVLQLPNVTLNGEAIPFPAAVTVNGTEASLDMPIEDRAEIRYTQMTDLRSVLASRGIDIQALGEQEIRVNLDGEDMALKSKQYTLRVNQMDVDINQERLLTEGDAIECAPVRRCWKLRDIVTTPPAGRDLVVKINGEEYVFPGGKGKLMRNGADADMEDEVHDGDIVRSVYGKDAEAVLVDIFRYISVAPQDQVGKRMKLLIDGQESQFTSPLHNNAEVKILFE